MKKRYFFIGAPIIFAIGICFYFFISFLVVHQSIITKSHSYQPQAITSFDKKYVLQTYKIEDDTGVYATFSVKRKDTQEEIFICPDRYRTMDLKSISWDGTTLDITIESGDVGSITYQFVNDTWQKE